MRPFLLFVSVLCLMLPVHMQGQTILRAGSGSVIMVQSGATLYISGGGLTADNGGTITNNGNIIIDRTGAPAADFMDNTPGLHSYGTGKFLLMGSGGPQNVLGSDFYDLEINNAAGVSMLGDATVSNTLLLTNGIFSIGANTLNLNGAVSGVGKLKGSPVSLLAIGGAAGTLNFDQTDSASRSVLDLTFNNGSATLGNAMQIYRLLGLTSSVFHISNKSLVLKSTGNGSTNTARVGNLTSSTVDGATNITVERYIASPQRAWHLLSARAVTGSQTIKQAWQENGAPIVAGQGTLVTSNLYNGSNGFDAASVSASILTHNQGGLAGPSYNYNLANTNSTVISSYPGYMLFVRGDRNYTAGNLPLTSPTVLRTNGTLTQGNQSAFISSTGTGRTLVANPYASPIDMETIFAGTTNLAQDMYVWDPSLGGNYGVGGYRLVQRLAPNTYQQTPVVLGGPALDPTSRYIHSGQAFFLRTTGTSGTTDATVNFTEATKASSVSVINPIVDGLVSEQLVANLMVVDAGNAEILADGIRVNFDNSYSSGITDDVEKLGNFNENISSYRQARKLIVENRPMIAAHDTIFLRMTNMGVKNYRFQVGTFHFTQANVIAHLKDAFTGANSPLDLSGNINNVDFMVTNNPASAAPDRFMIVFGPGAPLPISFIGIKAYQQGAGVAVEWKVAAELNMKNYEVERSTDGINFSKIGTQTATGNNNQDVTYSWLDPVPVPGNAQHSGDNFYRIRGIGNSGEVKYSPVAKVTIGKILPAISVFPNPVRDKKMNLQFMGMDKGNYQLRLINSIGQAVFTRQLTHAGGNAVQTIGLPKLAAGNYQLEIVRPDNSKEIKSMVIAD